MATLVLTAVGSAIGGPIGGALGAILGQQVDREIFAPGRRGPRLEDLRVQTSSYGTQIPKVFGTLRVAGTVIWATDLVESEGGGGKSGAGGYSYSVSFAVALSGRPIGDVKRIWAEGNLLRGDAGDFRTETEYRLHTGDEDQPVDPLIASAEADAPAYRGIAYAVFENFQLAPYGNRIPSLTFEVEAEDAPVAIGAIAGQLSGGEIGGAAAKTLGGYAASGDSVRGAVETLARATPLPIADDGEALLLSSPGEPVAIGPGELGSSPEARREERLIEQRATGSAAPVEIGVSYYEPERDYQMGLQRARRPGAGRISERIELPATLDASDAKRIAEANLARGWAERVERTVKLPWRRIMVRPGAHVSLPESGAVWRVAHWALERMALALTLVRVPGLVAEGGPIAEPGRPVTPPDIPHGPTVMHLLDLPGLEATPVSAPRLLIAAAGSSPGWRRAALSLNFDAGASWTGIGSTARAAVMGIVTTPPGLASPMLFDAAGFADVTLLHGGMALSDADDARMIDGTNLALIGEELIQFGMAEPLGGTVWRLRRLLRGRRGTEHAIAGHVPGERFILIDAGTLRAHDAPVSAIGQTVSAMASGVGDDDPVTDEAAGIGAAVRPPSPVRFRATPDGSGGFALSWTRRSRNGWQWLDAIDAPLGEETEVYRITVLRDGAAVRTIEIVTPAADYGAAQFAEDLGAGAAVTLSLVHIGSFAASRPAEITIEA